MQGGWKRAASLLSCLPAQSAVWPAALRQVRRLRQHVHHLHKLLWPGHQRHLPPGKLCRHPTQPGHHLKSQLSLPVCLCVGCRWLPLVALDPSPHLAAVLQCSDSLCQSCAWPSSCKKCYKYGLLAGRPFFPIYKEAGSGLCKLVGGAGGHHGPWSLSPLPSKCEALGRRPLFHDASVTCTPLTD